MIRAPLAAACGMLLLALPLRAQEPAPADTTTPAVPVRTWTMPDTVGTPRTRLTGWIVDAKTGEPLPGARIGIPRLRRSAVTGSKGEFALERVPAGTWPTMLQVIGYRGEVMMLPVDSAGGEVTLSMTPDAVVLEGLNVVSDRFARRRAAYPRTVRVFTAAQLANADGSARDVVMRRLGLMEVPCESMLGQAMLAWGPCVRIRGFPRSPMVYIDERPAMGGLDELEMYDGSDLAMVEVFGGGDQIRVYTPAFLERAARNAFVPEPIF